MKWKTYSLCLALILASGAAARSGSLEQVTPNAADLARELGIDMHKFILRWDKPVHCRLVLQVKEAGKSDTIVVTSVSEDAHPVHDFVFSQKNLAALRATLGFPANPPPKDPWIFSITSPAINLDEPMPDIFAGVGDGQVCMIYKPKVSREALPLDKPIVLYVKSGPWTAEQAAAAKDPKEEYILAPAWIHLSVTFSEKPFPAEGAK